MQNTMQNSQNAAEVFKFTPEDLQANAQGTITVRQFDAMRGRLRAKFWRDSAIFFVPASIVATPSIAICAVTARMDTMSANSAALLVGVLVIWTTIYLLAVFTLDRYLAGLDYLRWRSVDEAKGRVSLGDDEISFG